MSQREVSKDEIVREQLYHAVDLYLEGTNLICSITLAGAVEEILRERVIDEKGTPSINSNVDQRKEISAAWRQVTGEGSDTDEVAQRKAWHGVMDVRNELKHGGKGKSLFIDLDYQAFMLLKAAISDFKKLKLACDMDYHIKFANINRVFAERNSF